MVDGSGGWLNFKVDVPDAVGLYTSLIELANGQPAITYQEDVNDDLKYTVLMP